MNENAGRGRGVRIRKMVTLGIMSAIAFAAVARVGIPAVSFLRYARKEVIITIAGFIYGPSCSFRLLLGCGL